MTNATIEKPKESIFSVEQTLRSLNIIKDGEDAELYEDALTHLQNALQNDEIVVHPVDDEQPFKIKAVYAVFNKHYASEKIDFFCFTLPTSKTAVEKFVHVARHKDQFYVGSRCKSKGEAKYSVILRFLRHNGFTDELNERLKKEKILAGDVSVKRSADSDKDQPQAKKETSPSFQFDPAENLAAGTQFFLLSNNKNVNSLINEILATRKSKAAQYNVEQADGGFIAECLANDKSVNGVVAKSKQLAKQSAARRMIDVLVRDGYISTPEEIHFTLNQFKPPKSFEEFMRHVCFECLVNAMQDNVLATLTDPHLAGIVMVNAVGRTATLIALSTGSYAGPQIYNNGYDVRDCDAIVTCKRALQRFLMREVMVFYANPSASIFYQDKSVKLTLRPNVSFHLYTNYNPLPSEQSTSLRTKKTIGINKFAPRRFVPLSMVTADKMLKWNIMGVQGAILSQSLDPVFLKSITVNAHVDHDELHTMLCGRYNGPHILNIPQITVLPPEEPYNMNIGVYQPGERYGVLWSITEPQDCHILSCSSGFNWDGSPSIISRVGLFSVISTIYTTMGIDIGQAKYLDIKHSMNTADYYSKLYEVKKAFQDNKLGAWIEKNRNC